MQLPVPNNPAANVALAAGYLKSYAHDQGMLDRGVSIEILSRDFTDRGGDALLVEALLERQPTVLGISLYTWNSERSLMIASLVKARLPQLIVVVGGPEVQHNNRWVLEHPAVDLAVDGEGEQTFCAILERLLEPNHSACRWCEADPLAVPLAGQAALLAIPGTIHRHGAELISGPQRRGLDALDVVPSPYLAGYLELRPGEMALIECSRWCPYGCTFCLYGRNMGAKLGNRLFGVERVLAEVQWARDHGAGAIHFVEANLNLLPIFRELMAGLQRINTPDPTPLYAELRGEHLKPEAVEALVEAGLVTAEVGLQSANREALLRVGRRTDLDKWADGTRRLYQRNINVLLDVILGLPGEDRASTLQTIDWITQQNLGPYDVFTLQVLPGTGIRTDADQFRLRFQEQPPYYVLGTDALSYSELRGLRWELREAAGLDPLAVEGLPEPSAAAWNNTTARLPLKTVGTPIHGLVLDCTAPWSLAEWRKVGQRIAAKVASHLVVRVNNADLAVLESLCWPIAERNPSIHWDIIVDSAVAAARLRQLRERWPHTIGYLDRIAVFRNPTPHQPWSVVTPRWWLIIDWDQRFDTLPYEGIAEIVWRIDSVTWPQAQRYFQELPGTRIWAVDLTSEQRQACAELDLLIVNEGVAPSNLQLSDPNRIER